MSYIKWLQKSNGRPFRPFFTFLLVIVTVGLAITAPGHANPFETLASNDWAYKAVRVLDKYELGKAYVTERVQLNEDITYFDLALWVGESLSQMGAMGEGAPESNDQASLDRLVAAYNEAHSNKPISAEDAELLEELVRLVRDHLEVLGFAVPVDLQDREERGTSLQGIAKAFEDFRLRGESRIKYTDVGGLATRTVDGNESHQLGLQQSYTLNLSGPVSQVVNFGAEVEGEGRMWASGTESPFELGSGALDIGFSRSAIARLGKVSGKGMNDLVVGENDSRRLSGVQAGVQVGQLGSTLLVAASDGDEDASEDEKANNGMVAAWDGSVQVSDRLKLGASVARLDQENRAAVTSEDSTVIRLGGTLLVSPELSFSGEMAQRAGNDGGGGALKIGAVLHPFPELTVGASLFASGAGYRPILSTSKDDQVSRFDLSAEVGRWILALRRQNVVRTKSTSEDANLTRLSLEYPLGINVVGRASHEREEESGTAGTHPTGVKTEFDLEVHLDKGKVSLGYVLEDVEDSDAAGASSVRTARASVEHAVSPIGKALAGVSIVDQEEGSETSSNLGLKYDFDNASVMLQYEIFTKVGDVHGNVTTAEVSIKF